MIDSLARRIEPAIGQTDGGERELEVREAGF